MWNVVEDELKLTNFDQDIYNTFVSYWDEKEESEY